MLIEVCIPLPPDLADRSATVLNSRPDALPSMGWTGAHFTLTLRVATHIKSDSRGHGLDCLSIVMEAPLSRLLRVARHSLWFNARHPRRYRPRG